MKGFGYIPGLPLKNSPTVQRGMEVVEDENTCQQLQPLLGLRATKCKQCFWPLSLLLSAF